MNYRKIKIPPQDWSVSSDKIKEVKMSREVYNQLFDCISEFEVNGKIDPKVIREGLRSVNFHKEYPEIYKLIEDLCLDCELKETKLTSQEFMRYISNNLGDNVSRKGLNRIFESICDKRIGEITPENLVEVFRDELSEDDINYLLTVISDPSKEINIDSDEFYYIMAKKPGDAVKVMSVTKNIKES